MEDSDRPTKQPRLTTTSVRHELFDLRNCDALQMLESLADDSVDLVITDPPYITSRTSGMDKHHQAVQAQRSSGVDCKTPEQVVAYFARKSEAEWVAFMDSKGIAQTKQTDTMARWRREYQKVGSIYGAKYAVQTDYGAWDHADGEDGFTLAKLSVVLRHCFRVLRKGGTCIVWFDTWKTSDLKRIMAELKFKQPRLLTWVKTNPQPLNSGRNYLTNALEHAVLGIKGAKPTFNSSYDNGIYQFPIQGGKERFHKTQKSRALFEALLAKHSRPGDLVLDCFLGSATTAHAVVALNAAQPADPPRRVIGCERDETFFQKSCDRIKLALAETP